MTSMQYDVIVAGGGFAGSSLALALARGGVSVLLLEAETRFRDRVRGEALLPWGVAEARRLGIYDLLVDAGARPLPYRDFYAAGRARSRQNLAGESARGEPILSFAHADAQEALIRAAAGAGADVLRGARVRGLEPGCDPAVEFEIDGQVERATAKLVVGADGRTSRVRSLAGFEVSHGADGLLTTGVALEGLALDEDAVAAAVDPGSRASAALLPQGSGRARAYFTHRAGSIEAPPRSLQELVTRLTAAGLPSGIFSGVVAAGPIATFDGTPKWTGFPYRDGIALIGDAAAVSDPAWGQGMSLALRDVNVLSQALLSGLSANEAGLRYATEHARYATVNRVVSGLVTRAQFGAGPGAESLRASELWRRSGRALKAVHLDGPDIDLARHLLPGPVAAELATAASMRLSATATAC